MSAIPDAVGRQLIWLAWVPTATPLYKKMAEILSPYVGGPAAADLLLRTWLPASPFKIAWTPAALPNGDPIPAGSGSWPRDRSPVPGLEIAEAEMERLAEIVVLDHARAPDLLVDVDRLKTWSEATGHRWIPERTGDLSARWSASGDALAFMRRGSVPRDPAGWLDPHELDELFSKSFKGVKNLRKVAVWLIRHGSEPRAVARWLRHWPPENRQLPSGQWIPPQYELPLAPPRVLSDETIEWYAALIAAKMLLPATQSFASMMRVSLSTAAMRVNAMADAMRCGPSLAAALTEREASREEATPTPARALLDAAVEDLLVERTFYWSLLSKAVISEWSGVPTMGVAFDDRYRLRFYFNAEYVRSITHEERKAVIVHELNHVLFNHLRTPPWKREPQDPVKHELLMRAWTLACEASANEYVPYKLPGSPMTAESLGLPPGESTEKRFERLRKRKDLQEAVRDFFDNLVWHDDDGAREVKARRPVELAEAAKAVVQEAVAQMDGEVPDWLDGMLRPDGMYAHLEKLGRSNSRQVRWEVLLRTMVRNSSDRRLVRNWPSRRRPREIGIVPGHRARRGPCTVLVAIDTSASMTRPVLEKISAETERLVAAGAKVAVVQCDNAVQSDGWMRPGDRIESVRGRGGTSLTPPFEPTLLARYRPDLVVYFTDGDGEAPALPPTGVEVLWVLVGEGAGAPAPWGRIATMRA